MQNNKKKLLIKNKYQRFYQQAKDDYQKVTFESNDGVVVIPTVVGGYCLIEHVGRLSEVPSLELIRGFMEKNETSVKAALREMSEEMGIPYDASNIADIREYGSFAIDSALTNQRIHVVVIQLVHSLAKIKPQIEEGVSDVKWISRDAIKNHVDQITDGITLGALAKAKII